MDTTTGTIAWGNRFEIAKNLEHDAFDIITKRLTPAVVNKVVELEMMRITKAPPRMPDPMDLVLLGYGELAGRTPGSVERADERFRQALTIDGSFVPALLARVEARRADSLNDTDAAATLREADGLTLAAVTRDPECAASWVMRSSVLASMGHQAAALQQPKGRYESIRRTPSPSFSVPPC